MRVQPIISPWSKVVFNIDVEPFGKGGDVLALGDPEWGRPMNMNARMNRVVSILGLIISMACGGGGSGGGGGGGNKPQDPAISRFVASPATPITVGAAATLQPVFTGGVGVVQPGSITVISGVSTNVSPTSTTTYTLQVTNSANVSVSATAKVVVDVATTTVGTAGAVVKSPSGATVEIPFGALDRDTPITISATNVAPPAGVEAVSPTYRFEPEGHVFARPVKVSLPLPAGVTKGAIYWSRLGASGFDSIGGTISNGFITAEAPHFSLAVIGAATPTRAILGLGQTTWISATTRDSVPIDFASQGVEALVKDATGNLVAIAGVAGAVAGTFTISGVPDGNYILHSGTQYLVTSTSSPDLGLQSGGRPAPPRTVLANPTSLNLTVNGLDPWQAGDELEMFVTEEDDWNFDIEARLSPLLNAGITTASLPLDVSLFFGTVSGPSPISSQGDHAFLAQLTFQTAPSGVPFVAMSRIAPLPPFDLPDGASLSLSVDMLNVSAANTLSIDYRGTQWEAVLSDGNPAATNANGFFAVFAQAGSAEDGFYASNADLLIAGPGPVDLLSGPLNYGSPTNTTLPGNWGIFFDVRRGKILRPVLAGTTPLFLIFSGTEWTTTPAAAQTAPVTPPVSMPLNITVGGLPFFTADPARIGSGIGLTPTVRWSVPRVGSPALYLLSVFELVRDASNRTAGRIVANIITPELSFALPTGILRLSGSYAFSLSAAASTAPGGATVLGTAPFKTGLDIATAGTGSSVFTP
jgi:hypothetical protein